MFRGQERIAIIVILLVLVLVVCLYHLRGSRGRETLLFLVLLAHDDD